MQCCLRRRHDRALLLRGSAEARHLRFILRDILPGARPEIQAGEESLARMPARVRGIVTGAMRRGCDPVSEQAPAPRLPPNTVPPRRPPHGRLSRSQVSNGASSAPCSEGSAGRSDNRSFWCPSAEESEAGNRESAINQSFAIEDRICLLEWESQLGLISSPRE
jgi:hypothetical protein